MRMLGRISIAHIKILENLLILSFCWDLFWNKRGDIFETIFSYDKNLTLRRLQQDLILLSRRNNRDIVMFIVIVFIRAESNRF